MMTSKNSQLFALCLSVLFSTIARCSAWLLLAPDNFGVSNGIKLDGHWPAVANNQRSKGSQLSFVPKNTEDHLHNRDEPEDIEPIAHTDHDKAEGVIDSSNATDMPSYDAQMRAMSQNQAPPTGGGAGTPPTAGKPPPAAPLSTTSEPEKTPSALVHLGANAGGYVPFEPMVVGEISMRNDETAMVHPGSVGSKNIGRNIVYGKLVQVKKDMIPVKGAMEVGEISMRNDETALVHPGSTGSKNIGKNIVYGKMVQVKKDRETTNGQKDGFDLSVQYPEASVAGVGKGNEQMMRKSVKNLPQMVPDNQYFFHTGLGR